MTGTASPVPPHAKSDAIGSINGGSCQDGHHHDSPQPTEPEPSTPSRTQDAAALAPSSDGSPLSPLSELSDPPSDDELQPPTPEPAADAPEPPEEASPEREVQENAQPETNGHAEDPSNEDEERPAKRRRTRESTPPPSASRKSKYVSPPWKKIEAEGPTSFTADGKRRSGRINTVPLELQSGDKRITRRALHGQQQGSPPGKNKYASTNGHLPSANGVNSAPGSTRRPTTGAKQPPSKPVTTAKAPAKKPAPHETRSSNRTRKRSASPIPKTPLRSSTRTRRPSRHARNSLDHTNAEDTPGSGLRYDQPTRTTPRIKLKVNRPLPIAIPFIHPEQSKTRPKLGPTFEEYFEHVRDIPVEDGGQLAADDPQRMTDELAVREARILDRIETEAQDGGLLTEGRCSVFEPEPAEEPPRQWTHMDHLVKAMANFRKLMLIEQQRHRSTAKKLAEACRDEWQRKQPKTAMEIEHEAQLLWRGRYQIVVRAVFGTWENVKVEINRQRLEAWEAEEQRRVKAALQEAVDISEQKLQARRAVADSDGMTDDDSGIDRDSEEEEELDDEGEDEDMASGPDVEKVSGDDPNDEDESNMSSSDDDEDAKSALSDEGLTQEQLREKYAHLPALDTPVGNRNGDHDDDAPKTPGEDTRAGDTTGIDDDTSDESVDMDDDLGSTDMESEDDEGSDGDAEVSDGEDDDEEPPGLLGLLFGNSELKRLKAESTADTSKPGETVGDAMAANDAAVEPQLEVNGTKHESVPTASSLTTAAETHPKLNGEPRHRGGRDSLGPDLQPGPTSVDVGLADAQSVASWDKGDPTASLKYSVADSAPPPEGSAVGLSSGQLPCATTASSPSPTHRDDKSTVTTVSSKPPATTYHHGDTPTRYLSAEGGPPTAIQAVNGHASPIAGVVSRRDVARIDSIPATANPRKVLSTFDKSDCVAPIEGPLRLDGDVQVADLHGAVPEAAAGPGSVENGTFEAPKDENGTFEAPKNEDVPMTDADTQGTSSGAPSQPIPDVQITAPLYPSQALSPKINGVANNISPDPQPPLGLSDTIPTPSVEAPEAQAEMEISRSASPLPGAPKTEIPFLLRGTLREYQHFGLDWLAGLYANNTNGILADEMGLGKTIQTIALLAHLACSHEVWGPHLVIVPTSVMLNWEMEFKKWCPGFKILTYYGNQEERKRKRQGWTNDDIWNVCITSYQMVLQDQQVFRRRRWHYMILDEAHNIKNFKSQRWQTLLGFNTQARLLLTGTPLQNNLTELWSLLFFLMPSENGVGGFADLREFHDWFSKPESQILESGREQMDDEARAIISKLHKVLRPYLLRRLKADVEKQMPAKYEHVELCRLSKRQRELYDGFLSRTDTRETLSSGNYLSIINCLMQLRKVCNHPDLFVDRPIMTSFRMQSSVPATFEPMERLVRDRLFAEDVWGSVSLPFMNLVPTEHERFSDDFATSVAQLSSHRALMDLKDAQRVRAQNAFTPLDPSTVESNIIYIESALRWGRFEELQHCVYLNALRRQQRPIYGKRLVDLLTIGIQERPFRQKPRVPKKIIEWFENDSFLLHNAVQTLDRRADAMEMTITKFACVTPAVVTRDLMPFLLGRKGIQAFEEADLRLSAPVKILPFVPGERPHDPWHEARMRLSIQFPDKRLLQYDCGKLQALDRLLRKLQSGGHRALIFTQMTKVLDILEQFLNIHGHKYLRLDGATKVEQRQIMTDRFNHDTRITCFILSTRSGGLGINLTGADTVIFYDQDWNPAMDKQCQDRCHRIGQTRDVHIYRLVSEHTIEANILRKASQKQMLDDVVIQEGEFTTDYFNKISVRDVIGDGEGNDALLLGEGDVAANAAMDRVLGGVESTDQRTATRVLEQAEDREDVDAARLAEKEIQQDDADFNERPTPNAGGSASGVSSARMGTPREDSAAPVARAPPSSLGIFSELIGGVGADEDAGDAAGGPSDQAVEVEYNAWGGRVCNIDNYMLGLMAAQLEGTPLELPKDKKKSKKKGKDMRKR